MMLETQITGKTDKFLKTPFLIHIEMVFLVCQNFNK
jgi:hypothetical protein